MQEDGTNFPLAAPPGISCAAALEEGSVLRWGPPGFALQPAERDLISADRVAGKAKNISYDPSSAGLRHAAGAPSDLELLKGILARYSAFCDSALAALLPEYTGGMRRMRTSFRPAEIEGRASSWRHDDRLRHVDAFPSSPTGGRRILRMFYNADQAGRPRVWRTGPDFESYANALWPHATVRPIPGIAALRAWAGLTKARRTLYDAQMLALHDAAKRDRAWQDSAPAEELTFMPGETWLVFTDLVPHAVIAGCNALEQTFLVDEACLVRRERSPLAMLSRRSGQDMRRLI